MNIPMHHIFLTLCILFTIATPHVKAAAGTNTDTHSLCGALESGIVLNQLKGAIYLTERCYDWEGDDYRNFMINLLEPLVKSSCPTTATDTIEIFLRDLGFIQKGTSSYEQLYNRVEYMHYIINLFGPARPLKSILRVYKELYTCRHLEGDRLSGPTFLQIGRPSRIFAAMPLSHTAAYTTYGLFNTKLAAVSALAASKNALELFLNPHKATVEIKTDLTHCETTDEAV